MFRVRDQLTGQIQSRVPGPLSGLLALAGTTILTVSPSTTTHPPPGAPLGAPPEGPAPDSQSLAARVPLGEPSGGVAGFVFTRKTVKVEVEEALGGEVSEREGPRGALDWREGEGGRGPSQKESVAESSCTCRKQGQGGGPGSWIWDPGLEIQGCKFRIQEIEIRALRMQGFQDRGFGIQGLEIQGV